jgi:hypothetical protein
MFASEKEQRIYGLVSVIAGSVCTVGSWYIALTEGFYYRKFVFFFPFFAVFGFGPLWFPICKKRVGKRYGVDIPQPAAQYPLSWKILFFVALAAALGNLALISHL